MSVLAVTGGTGFVGSHLLDLALAQEHAVRALARRPQPPRAGVTWIAGALDRPDSLAALVAGADAVIHVAGVVNAPDRAGFAAGNQAGTAAMIAATRVADVTRFVQVSSLAAREPDLSNYGWSKAKADLAVIGSGLDWTIVRPPGVFGPRDTETLPLFRAAASGIVPLPPAGGRGSWIYAPDLAALLLRLATSDTATCTVVEPDDGAPGGWDHRDFARAIGAAVGRRRVLPLPLPRRLLAMASWAGRRTGGPLAKLTADRVGYLAHPDWTSHAPPPADLWRPAIATPDALAVTAAWYRAQGLL
jgi:uncharacterized protein YbjT (DUF2867 family)